MSMYNFVRKSDLLPITKTTNVHHFYEFQGKQLHQKKMQQKKQLDDFLNQIQQEEAKQKPNKSEPLKVTALINKDSVLPHANKSYFIDFSSLKHSSNPHDSNKPRSTRSFNEFYEKNKKWKENLEAQILRKKTQKIQQQEREISQCRKPLSEFNSKMDQSANQSKNSQSLHHAFESKGPISGWTQRFHEYINKRLPQCPEVEFKPTINKKSKMIAGRMVGKVQDRLIKFGEILKMRKHEMIIEEAAKIGRLPRNQADHYASIQTNQSDLFFRLFKQGQKTNRRVKQQSERKQFSFKPEISKIPQEMEKKVQQKREKSPLYTAKKFTKQETHRLLELYTKQTGKSYSEVEFQNFMKRNKILLDKKNRQMQQKVREDMMKEEKEFQECTFIPLLNPRSVRMFEKPENDRSANVSMNEHVDYEYSHDELPLEESPSQLFTTELKPTSKKSTQMKPRPKYSYPHSYTEQSEDFEYEIRTPSKHEISQGGMSQSKSPINPKNDLSEMDSLEFSTHRPHTNKNFNKPTPQHSNEKDENEVINYELTFSNTKLAHELSEINHIEEEGEEPVTEELSLNEKQAPKNSNMSMSMRSERELYEYNERKEQLESSWESELEKVKNRLQTLMKGQM